MMFLAFVVVCVAIELAIVAKVDWIHKAVLSWKSFDLGFSFVLGLLMFGGISAIATNLAILVLMAGFFGNVITSFVYAYRRKVAYTKLIRHWQGKTPMPQIMLFPSAVQTLKEDWEAYQESLETGVTPIYKLSGPPPKAMLWAAETFS